MALPQKLLTIDLKLSTPYFNKKDLILPRASILTLENFGFRATLLRVLAYVSYKFIA